MLSSQTCRDTLCSASNLAVIRAIPISSIVPEFPAGTYHYTGTEIVSKVSAPLTPVRKTSMRQAESLSVGKDVVQNRPQNVAGPDEDRPDPGPRESSSHGP